MGNEALYDSVAEFGVLQCLMFAVSGNGDFNVIPAVGRCVPDVSLLRSRINRRSRHISRKPGPSLGLEAGEMGAVSPAGVLPNVVYV